MGVSQFSLQANLETVSVRISQRQPGTAYLESLWPLGLCKISLIRTFLSIKIRFKDDGSEATRALLRKYSNYSRIAHITTVNLS